MKRLIALVFIGALMTLSVNAAHFASSFFNNEISSICVSNTIGVSNLLSTISVGTNNVGTTYTNYAGTRVVTAADASASVNLLRDIELPAHGAVTISTNDTSGQTLGPFTFSLYTRLVGTSGANSAVNFYIVPVPDGEKECTATADIVTVAVTATTTTEVRTLTPIPLTRFMNCKKIRLRAVTNTDTDATSRVDILECKLVGFAD